MIIYLSHLALLIDWCLQHIKLSKFLRRSLLIFIIKVSQTIVFIFIVISTMFQPIGPSIFFRCLSNSGIFTELQTTSFIETMRVACSDSVCHNRVQVLSIPVLLLTCTEDWTCNLQMIVSLEAQRTNAYNRYAMCPAGQFRVKNAGGHIVRNVVEITIKMKTIVRKTLMIKSTSNCFGLFYA